MKKLLILLLLLYPLSALAETYEWTDQEGTVHFTEDLGQVPKKFRKKAKRLGSEEAAPASSATGEPARGAGKGEEESKGKKLYGGKDETAWRTAFRRANGEMQQAESELATLKDRLKDTSTMSRTEYLSVQNTIKHTETVLKERQRKLDALQREADREGVPSDLRQ